MFTRDAKMRRGVSSARQTRSICDGPKMADGSWTRFRMVWVPAHQVPVSTYCGTYSCSTSGGYFQPDQVFEKVKYPVTPDYGGGR